MNTTDFVFDTNAKIQRVCVGDVRVGSTYAMSLHKIIPRISNQHVNQLGNLVLNRKCIVTNFCS